MEKNEVIYKETAKSSIRQIAFYIEANGYPETAEKFAEKLYDFGDSLKLFPNKFPVCRHKPLAKRGFRCAVFKDNYVFVYKIMNKQVVIYNVVHSMSFE